jgi:2-polyprenyl-3-methyl-5-hydroxy-6-metoxy-1,4-benzoquinol methylase
MVDGAPRPQPDPDVASARAPDPAGFIPYICPTCQSQLEPANGGLRCIRGHDFTVAEGLPRFVAEEGYSASFGLQWQTFSRVQLDSHSHTSLTRDRFFHGTRWPERMEGELILEAGCGSGRFTEVLLGTGARVVSFDYSRAADVAARTFGRRAQICQASIYEMPYQRGSFDRVFCYGVIQHCPDVRAAFMALVEMVRPGGHLAVDVYDLRRLPFTARYRVRWLTRRLDKERLLRWCRRIVPTYQRLMPPLHPWNQLVFPIKDLRGVFPGLSRDDEVEMSILDTFDMLSPEFDQPQSLTTIRRWCREAGLRDVEVQRGGNGIEARARRPG